MYTYTYIATYMYTYTYTYTYSYTHAYICIYIAIYMHAYTYIHTYIYYYAVVCPSNFARQSKFLQWISILCYLEASEESSSPCVRSVGDYKNKTLALWEIRRFREARANSRCFTPFRFHINKQKSRRDTHRVILWTTSKAYAWIVWYWSRGRFKNNSCKLIEELLVLEEKKYRQKATWD